MVEINGMYLAKDTATEIRALFKENCDLPSVRLQHFLDSTSYAALKEEIMGLPFRKERDPLLHSYTSARCPKKLSALLQSKRFLSFVAAVTQHDILELSGSVLSFGWKDYTLINDKAIEKPGIDVIMDFSDDWDDAWGGSIVYTPGTGNVTRISPCGNTLIIVERNEGVHRFVQYVNHYAAKKRRHFVIATISF